MFKSGSGSAVPLNCSLLLARSLRPSPPLRPPWVAVLRCVWNWHIKGGALVVVLPLFSSHVSLSRLLSLSLYEGLPSQDSLMLSFVTHSVWSRCFDCTLIPVPCHYFAHTSSVRPAGPGETWQKPQIPQPGVPETSHSV